MRIKPPLGLVFTAGRNQFGDYSSNEADDYGPEKAQHVSIPHRLLAATDCPVLGAATRAKGKRPQAVDLRPLEHFPTSCKLWPSVHMMGGLGDVRYWHLARAMSLS